MWNQIPSHCSGDVEPDRAWESHDSWWNFQIQHIVLTTARGAIRGLPYRILPQGETWHHLDLTPIRDKRLLDVNLHTPLSSKYATIKERDSRFKIFKGSLQEIDVLNAAAKASNRTEVCGITKFSDFKPWEMGRCTIEVSRISQYLSVLTGEEEPEFLHDGSSGNDYFNPPFERNSALLLNRIQEFKDYFTGKMRIGAVQGNNILEYYDFLSGKIRTGDFKRDPVTDYVDFFLKNTTNYRVNPVNFKIKFFASPGMTAYEPTSASRPPYGETERQNTDFDIPYNWSMHLFG